jgi:uncharacterized protein (DUF1919 family)
MNCTGGILYHDLGLKFLSPTVNLYMKAEDFIKFCENLEHYISIDTMVPCTDAEIVQDRKYPVVWLGDILLYLVHYHSVDDALQKWNSRKKRINWDKIVILNNDREGMNFDLKDRFEKLPYKKIMFTHLPDNTHSSCHYLPGYESCKCVGIITDAEGWRGKRPIDQFDWVKFLNEV